VAYSRKALDLLEKDTTDSAQRREAIEKSAKDKLSKLQAEK
jgi:hypothetical protein